MSKFTFELEVDADTAVDSFGPYANKYFITIQKVLLKGAESKDITVLADNEHFEEDLCELIMQELGEIEKREYEPDDYV